MTNSNITMNFSMIYKKPLLIAKIFQTERYFPNSQRKNARETIKSSERAEKNLENGKNKKEKFKSNFQV